MNKSQFCEAARKAELPLFGILNTYLRDVNLTIMPEEIDYRSLTENQLKNELKKLENSILEKTGDPLKLGRAFFDWASDDARVEKVQELMSTRSFILSLLFEKHCTPAEVTRLEKVNALLPDRPNDGLHGSNTR